MADIYEVAKLSGVSIATVSRVINNSPRVSAETKERILGVIERVGYVPNAFARGLNFNSIGLVGVLCTDFGDAFFSQAVSYIEKNLRDNGFGAMLVCTGYTLAGKKQGLVQLANKNVDAIILVGTVFQEEHNEYIAEVAEKIPVFTVNSVLDYENVYSVKCDEKGAAHDVATALVQAGCRSPLCLFENPSYGSIDKLEGFREGLEEAGLALEKEQRLSVVEAKRTVVSVIADYFKQHTGKIDSVFAYNDALAVYALKAMNQAGIGQLPTVGFNNSTIAQLSTPELTSVDNRLEEMCRLSVEKLVQLQNEKKKPEKITVLTGKIVHRETF